MIEEDCNYDPWEFSDDPDDEQCQHRTLFWHCEQCFPLDDINKEKLQEVQRMLLESVNDPRPNLLEPSAGRIEQQHEDGDSANPPSFQNKKKETAF